MVGDASYAAVAHLVQVHVARTVVPVRLFTLAATVEVARTTAGSTQPPLWLIADYSHAIEELSFKGMHSLHTRVSRTQTSAVLPLLYVWQGFTIYAAALLEYSEEELGEFFIA
jgi:hypothetical protein